MQEVLQRKLSMMLLVLSAVVISTAIPAVAVVVLSADNPQSGDVCNCRLAIESILDVRDLKLAGTPTFAVKVDTLIHDHLSPRLEEEQTKYIADQFKRLWGLASKAVRPLHL